MINPGGIPTIPGDMDALAAHAKALSTMGGEFSHTGQRVNTTWQGLSGVYRAPEVGQLLSATAPVQSITASTGTDIQTAGAALSTYAGEVKAIKARLESLRAQATAFVHSVAGHHDWQSDSHKVDQNNQLINAVNVEVAAFFDAQRRCANTINALYGGQQYHAETGNGHNPADYGYTAAQLQAAAKAGQSLPWGKDEQHDRGFFGDVGQFFSGVWDGATQFVTGLGALIGYSGGHWSFSTAGTAWEGLGKFAVALGVYATPEGMLLDQTVGVPGFKRGEMGQTLLTAGKSLVAYNEWSTDPARAAGTTTFNVVSAVLGTKGAGAALRGAGTAAEASDIATVARVGSVMTRGGELVDKIPTVSDLASNVAQRIPMFRIPDIAAPEMDIPTAHVDIPPATDIPTVHPGSIGDSLAHTPELPHLPDTHLPDTHLPDTHLPGTHLPDTHLPDHTPEPITTPEPHSGPGSLDTAHNPASGIHDPVGAPHETVGAPHETAPGTHEPGGHDTSSGTHEPVGSGHHDTPPGSHEHTSGPHDGHPGDGHTGHTGHQGGAPSHIPGLSHGHEAAVGPHDVPVAHVPPHEIPPPLHRDEPLPGRELNSHYHGENDPTNPDRAFYPHTVQYMSPARLEEHRLFVHDGKLYSADDGAPFDTGSASTLHNPTASRAMFVMDRDGNLYASNQQILGTLHHSSFLRGEPVAGAGEIDVRDGIVRLISRKSGHYLPLPEQEQAVREILAAQGIDVSKIRFEAGF